MRHGLLAAGHAGLFARVAVAGVLIALVGCGASRIIVSVDSASFMSEEDLNPEYGPVPAILPPVSLRFGPEKVEIPEGISGITDIEEADLSVRARVSNTTGSGLLELRLFFAAVGEDPFAQAPAGTYSVPLGPGETVDIEEITVLTQPVRDLFTDSSIQFAYEIVVDAAGSASDVEGAVAIEEILVRVVHDPNLGS